MAGKQDTAPIDVTRGGALSQLTHELRLWDQIPKGGPIVWPILAILVVGIAIALTSSAVFGITYAIPGLVEDIFLMMFMYHEAGQSPFRFLWHRFARVYPLFFVTVLIGMAVATPRPRKGDR